MSAKAGTIAIIVVCHENVFIIYVYWAMLLFRYLVVWLVNLDVNISWLAFIPFC